uniref:Uncharacterized protein n=1 Tax=Romanomermis culicivorax TaxID=13658 RepID=A0A915HTF5_ROMCU
MQIQLIPKTLQSVFYLHDVSRYDLSVVSAIFLAKNIDLAKKVVINKLFYLRGKMKNPATITCSQRSAEEILILGLLKRRKLIFSAHFTAAIDRLSIVTYRSLRHSSKGTLPLEDDNRLLNL